MALVVKRPADHEDRVVLGRVDRPRAHVEAVRDGAERQASFGEIGAKAGGAILTAEGGPGQPADLDSAFEALQRARRRLLIGVAVEDRRQAGGGGDHGRGGQVVLDDRHIRAAPLQEPPDRPGLGEIAARRDRRNG